MSHRQIIEEFNQTALDKKLLAYAVAAGAILSGASPAQAAIQYTNVTQTLLSNGNAFNIVFGGELKFKVRLTTFSSVSSIFNSVWVQPQTYNASFLATSSGSFAKGPATNYVISSARSTWSNTTYAGTMAGYNQTSLATINVGAFRGKTRFLGLKFQIGGNTHYGWCKVSVPSNASSATILGHAYEDDSGITGIKAGETDVSLPVTLNTFSAMVMPEGICLEWCTESEVDNSGFILERRLITEDASDWVQIASYDTHPALRGSGNTSERTEYMFTDPDVEPAAFYEYRITSVSTLGEQEFFQAITVENNNIVPENLFLDQNYPNPFNAVTKIKFALPETEKVSLKIYSIDGKLAATLVDKELPAGSHEITWDAGDLVTGNYIYELKSSTQRVVKKLNYIK